MGMRTALQRILSWGGLLVVLIGLAACPPNLPPWAFIQYTVYTGGDDLDGSKSLAVAYLSLTNGTTYTCGLNGYSPPSNQVPIVPGDGNPSNTTLHNDTTQTVTCPLGPPVDGLALQGAKLWVELWQQSCQLSCDNWDVEGLTASVYQYNPQGNPGVAPAAKYCLINVGYFGPGDHGENPSVARLKGGQGIGSHGPVHSSTPVYTAPSC